MQTKALAIALALTCLGAAPKPAYDLVIRGGTIYDGSGRAGVRGDVAIKGDRIAYVGPHAPGRGAREVAAAGKAVAPGFVNMLSWSTDSLMQDGRGLSAGHAGLILLPLVPLLIKVRDQLVEGILAGALKD